MRKLLLFYIVLILATSVFADIVIENVDFEPNPIIYSIYSDMNWKPDFNNTDSNLTTGTINVYIDNVFKNSGSFSLNGFERKVFEVDINTPSVGEHTAMIKVINVLPDANVINQDFNVDFNVFEGFDFFAIFIDTNVLNPKLGEVIKVFGSVKNLGDLTTPDAKLRVKANSNTNLSKSFH